MRVGEPVHAVKFMVRVREEHTEGALGVLQDSVAPVLRGSGFREVLVVARRRQIERLNLEGPGVVDSPVLKRLLRSAPPDDPRYVDDLRSLHRDLAVGVNSAVHAMSHHNKKERRPTEYEALRRELYAEENRLRVAGRQLDCYALYGSEADLKADVLDLKGKEMLVPHSARFLSDALDGLLFLRFEGFYQTVLQEALPGPPPVGEGLHVTQSLMNALPRGENPGERIRCLVDGLASQRGFAGFLALRSRSAGFSRGLGWRPSGLRQHRGDEPDPEEGGARRPLVPHQASSAYELLTLWLKETDSRAAARFIAGLVQGLPGGALSEKEIGAGARGRVLSGLGELALRA